MPRADSPLRRVCFVTGTRAEFGLMQSTLRAIAQRRDLALQLIVTGMHLDRSRGRSLDGIRAGGWNVDALVPWASGDGSPTAAAVAMGRATAALASSYKRLQSDIVMVVGDRVEAFAAASAAHVSARIVAHVHGGDRALGLVDDSLRHAITKLAHLHFPATALSAERIKRMGEDRWRVVRAGSPGLDDIRAAAASRDALKTAFPNLPLRRFALLVLHPESTDATRERATASLLLHCVKAAGFEHVFIVYPNNDPGSAGIASCWDGLRDDASLTVRRDLPRAVFLGLMRETVALVGNSSSGIIEAASFGTPVLDVGDRQAGRERGENVAHASVSERAIRAALARIWNEGAPIRFPTRNVYGRGGAGKRIAAALARVDLERSRGKLIAY